MDSKQSPKPKGYYSFDQVVMRNKVSQEQLLLMFRTITTMLSALPALHGQLRLKDPKSNKSRRDVRLLSALATLLVRNHEVTAVVMQSISTAAGNIGVLATARAEDSVDGGTFQSDSQDHDPASHATTNDTTFELDQEDIDFKQLHEACDDDDDEDATPHIPHNRDLTYIAVNNTRHDKPIEQDAFQFGGETAEIFLPTQVSISDPIDYASNTW